MHTVCITIGLKLLLWIKLWGVYLQTHLSMIAEEVHGIRSREMTLSDAFKFRGPHPPSQILVVGTWHEFLHTILFII